MEMRMTFMTNQIISRNKNRDMVGTSIMTEICRSPHPHIQLKKVEDFPYPYPYLINAGSLCQNGDEFEQYPKNQFIHHL